MDHITFGDEVIKIGDVTLPLKDSFDPVDKPAHYNLGGGVECIDYIKQVLGLDA